VEGCALKIWLINHYAVLPTQAGGARHYSLAKELVSRGHDVTVIASSFDHATRTEAHLDSRSRWKLEVLDGVNFVWIRTHPYSRNDMKRIVNMVGFACRVCGCCWYEKRGAPDVVIGSTPHLIAALSAERLAKRWQVPFVLEVRDLWPQGLIDVGGYSQRNPAIRALRRTERHLYANAQRIVSLLPGAVEYIAGHGGERERIAWIPNGIDLGIAPEPSPPRERSQFVITYAGAHGITNGLDSVLDAAQILQCEGLGDKVVFRLIGDGPEKCRLQRRAKDEALDLVHFETPVSKRDVYNELQESDILIATLRKSNLYRYGISLNKIYDYMAVARPVVFGADSLNNPIAESGAGIAVAPEDAKAMARAIGLLMATPLDKRWEMGLLGREYVETHHDFARLAIVLEAVLVSAVETYGAYHMASH
jgi:glycosyltransferase involved in cell wall biosynthesis